MGRFREPRSKRNRNFRKGTKILKKNYSTRIQRGGIRL